jgi:hypothetical protein
VPTFFPALAIAARRDFVSGFCSNPRGSLRSNRKSICLSLRLAVVRTGTVRLQSYRRVSFEQRLTPDAQEYFFQRDSHCQRSRARAFVFDSRAFRSRPTLIDPVENEFCLIDGRSTAQIFAGLGPCESNSDPEVEVISRRLSRSPVRGSMMLLPANLRKYI